MSITREEIIKGVNKAFSDNGQNKKSFQSESFGVLKSKKVNSWITEAKSRGIQKMLLDEFWLEGQLCVCFGPTGSGKSVLAYQASEAIARGRNADSRLRINVEPQQVFYLDFELSEFQVKKRYTDNNELNPYVFSSNFDRVELDLDSIKTPDQLENISDTVISSIGQAIDKNGYKIVIVDNITYLGTDRDKQQSATVMMHKLNKLKKSYGLSMLVLAHTPKRNDSEPILINDLGGSRVIADFADSIFAIGKNNEDSAIRYLKQIKQRDLEERYHKDNVIKCDLRKDDNFLKFVSFGVGGEFGMIKTVSQEEKDRLEHDIKIIKENNPGFSLDDIAKEAQTSKNKVWRTLNDSK